MGWALGTYTVAGCEGHGAKHGYKPCTAAGTASSILLHPEAGASLAVRCPNNIFVWMGLTGRNSSLLICKSKTENEASPRDASADSIMSQVSGIAKSNCPAPLTMH